jgi:hypothetical protein
LCIPLGPSATTLIFLFITILRPVPLQHVFLPTMQSVGPLTSLTKAVFFLQILALTCIILT